MTKFSANLGFLWTDLSLPDAIHAAKSAGFAAVECHWPYDTPATDVRKALEDTGLPMLGLNTRRGDTDAGENGLSALPGRFQDAKAAIDEALDYAGQVGARAVHVMAGFAFGAAAHDAFCASLQHACASAKSTGQTILIEPLNRHDAPGYFLQNTNQAHAIIEQINQPNLKLMFDCYHVGRTEGDITTRLETLMPIIGHIQFASVPDRGAPDHGELNYRMIFDAISRLGYREPLGAEYKPKGPTGDSLRWLPQLA